MTDLLFFVYMKARPVYREDVFWVKDDLSKVTKINTLLLFSVMIIIVTEHNQAG